MKNDLEGLLRGIINIKKIAQTEMINVRIEIKSIIENKITDREYIENTLDHLLNLVLLGFEDKEFHELNDFYTTFDSQNAESYRRFYEELIEEKY